LQRRLDRLQAEVAREHPRFGRGRREVPARITPLSADAPHLGERLGLFVIIVLGEGLVLLISAASEITWDAALVAAGAGGFTLIVALWAVGVRYGYAGLALVPSGTGIADAPPGRLEGPGRAGRIWCRCQAEHRGCR
jgi:Bacterial low temperature requirement A protein (LtrA)